jgi:hypothetical protein
MNAFPFWLTTIVREEFEHVGGGSMRQVSSLSKMIVILSEKEQGVYLQFICC